MATAPSLLLVNCGQLLTLDGPRRPRAGTEMEALGLVRHGAVLIVDGQIVSVGPEHLVVRSPQAGRAVHLDACGQVVLPGFVDSHTHALFAAPRVDEYVARIRGATYQEIAKAGGGIQASARLMRATNEPTLVTRLTSVTRQFLEYGTTTVEVKSGYGLEINEELKMLRAIGIAGRRSHVDLVTTLLAHAVPARFARQRARFLSRWAQELIPQVARERRAEFFDIFCDRGYFSVAEARRLLGVAAQAGLKVKLHAEQLAHTGAARLAAACGAVSADHLDRLTEADIRCLRRAGTVATLLPGTTLHLGAKEYPPARRLIQAGVPVALATNFNPGSSPTVNMQLILSLACAQMRMSPAEAMTAATINGAYALGRGGRVGSLEPGKQADLAIMDVSDYREIPYYFGINHCRTVIRHGQVVYSKEQMGAA